MADLETENLERLIARIDAVISGLPNWNTDYRAWHLASHSAFETLLLEEGGTTRPKNVHATHVDLAGITSSSTAGPVAALRNWQVAARKRIAKIQAGEA